MPQKDERNSLTNATRDLKDYSPSILKLDFDKVNIAINSTVELREIQTKTLYQTPRLDRK